MFVYMCVKVLRSRKKILFSKMKDPYLIERKGNVYHATKVKRFVLSVCLIIGTPKSYPPNYKAPCFLPSLKGLRFSKKKKGH